MICFVDVETTGLNPRYDALLEIALVVTTDDLEEVGAIDLVVRPVASAHPLAVDDVVQRMHTENGLWRDVEERGLRRYEAAPLLHKFIEDVFRDVPLVVSHNCVICGKNDNEHVGLSECSAPGGTVFTPRMESARKHTPFGGSTVGFDRSFLREAFPEIEKQFSHRSIDVSSITELARRWSPTVYKNRPKAGDKAAHRALADVRESIAYLRYYRAAGFLVGRAE